MYDRTLLSLRSPEILKGQYDNMNHKYDRRQFLTSSAQTCSALLTGTLLLQAPAASSAMPTQSTPAGAKPSSIDSLNCLLILDRESVAAAEHVEFHLNPAQKHAENPLLSPGAAHEWDGLQITWPGTVLYDNDDQMFRCWYSGIDAVQKNRPPLWVPGYAESPDGIHWTKPVLGQYRHNDLPTNRIVVDFSDKVLSLVMKNPDQSNPARKFLALWHNDQQGFRKVLASSPDGKVWKNEGFAFVPVDADRGSYFDVYQLLHQPDAPDENDRYIGYAQLYRPYQGRSIRQIGMVHGPHPGALTPYGTTDEEFVCLRPGEGIDEEHHFASVLKVGQQTVMLFESDNFSKDPLHGDLRLAVSRDGRQFRRVHPQTPCVSTGAKGMWDENLLVTSSASMQLVGDEIRIYYFGCPGVYRFWPYGPLGKSELRASFYYPSYMGMATLPRDRFAYATGPGSITTEELTIGPSGVWLNAEGSDLLVSCLAPGGKVLAEGHLPATDPQQLYRQVQWTTPPPPTPCQLKISLSRDQRLYSVRY